ncbi:hypothetical protein ABLE68_18510 [Nocardioides sp. CN2-186]|uniref:hypothetical protein n=1 Tax=Nocardioides tweenelious TaxID=3156607 RepID=UPI0032B52D41
MILGLCLILATATICTIAALSPRTASGVTTANAAPRPARTRRPARAVPQTMRRELSRRAAQLPVHPEIATPLDVEFLLAQDLDPDAATRCVASGVAHGLSAPTMWRFGARYGADKLALALQARTSERTMLWHLESGSVPDWGPMSLFAVIDGEEPVGAVPLGEVIAIDLVPQQRAPQTEVDDWSTPVPRPAAEPIDLSRFADLPPITSPGLVSR